MVLTLDIDGVVAAMAQCDFDKSLRTWTNYRQKEAHPSLDVTILNRLIANYHTYFVSARSFEGASDCTREWLREKGVNVERALGVICTEGVGRMYDRGECPYEYASDCKPALLQTLGSTVHIDDHPGIIAKLREPTIGLLFYNSAFLRNINMFAERTSPKAKTWQEVEAIVNNVWQANLNERNLNNDQH